MWHCHEDDDQLRILHTLRRYYLQWLQYNKVPISKVNQVESTQAVACSENKAFVI